MSKISKPIISFASTILFVIAIFPVNLLGQNRKDSFKDLYCLENVYKAEVSIFKEDEYKQIDHKELLKVLQCSKGVIAKFIPRMEVILYEQGVKAH